ncbi:MAG: hypothetical protein IB618_01530 [Candidatus Pacearchaeota archaeon]|nr:MAG: hypothetical protein IB618_01530 [Candidatus Pacearchaeota archaeon]
MVKKNNFIIIILMLSALLIASIFINNNFGNAVIYSNESIEAKESLENARADMQEMIEMGFNVIRVNDTLIVAEQIYLAQLALEEKKKRANYETVLEKCAEIRKIKEKAFQAYDELKVLEVKINKTTQDKDVNLTEVIAVFEQAKQEFIDERYEQCLILIEKTYEKIDRAESEAARSRVFYIAASRTIGGFFERNWKIIITVLAVIGLAYYITRKKIERYLLRRKMKKLELEKKVLRGLIAKTQKDYFEKGLLSEGSYRIKIKKFGELIRDIDRQIPLIKEELEKIKKQKPEKQPRRIQKEVRRISVPKPPIKPKARKKIKK